MTILDINNDDDCDLIIAELGQAGMRANLRELHGLHAAIRNMLAEVSRVTGRPCHRISDVSSAIQHDQPKGNGYTTCRLCGESIIGTPDGSVCLGGHPVH